MFLCGVPFINFGELEWQVKDEGKASSNKNSDRLWNFILSYTSLILLCAPPPFMQVNRQTWIHSFKSHGFLLIQEKAIA